MQATFAPKDRKIYSYVFKIAFDNQSECIYNLQGSGVIPYLSITSVNGSELTKMLSSNNNNNNKHNNNNSNSNQLNSTFLLFGPVTPNYSVKKSVTVNNLSDIPIKFHWELFHHNNNNNTTSNTNNNNTTLLSSSSSSNPAFTIFPSQGVFKEDESITFQVEFCHSLSSPSSSSSSLDISSTARLVVDDVPNTIPNLLESSNGNINNIPTKVPSNSNNSSTTTSYNNDSSREDLALNLVHLHAIELALSGRGVPCDVTLSTPAILFPSPLILNQVFYSHSILPSIYPSPSFLFLSSFILSSLLYLPIHSFIPFFLSYLP